MYISVLGCYTPLLASWSSLLHRSGSIEIEEMSAIAIKRRELGHKKDIWTDEKNRKLVNRLDANCNGLISAREFIKYYSRLHSACNALAFIDVIGCVLLN